MNQRNHCFPQSAPVIDLSAFRRGCGHNTWEDCQCRKLPNGLGWVDPYYLEWLDEQEAEK